MYFKYIFQKIKSLGRRSPSFEVTRPPLTPPLITPMLLEVWCSPTTGRAWVAKTENTCSKGTAYFDDDGFPRKHAPTTGRCFCTRLLRSTDDVLLSVMFPQVKMDDDCYWRWRAGWAGGWIGSPVCSTFPTSTRSKHIYFIFKPTSTDAKCISCLIFGPK